MHCNNRHKLKVGKVHFYFELIYIPEEDPLTVNESLLTLVSLPLTHSERLMKRENDLPDKSFIYILNQ